MQQANIPDKKKAKAIPGNKANPNNDRNQEQEKAAGTNATDTAPDEFIAPNADTDLPIEDRGIVNDAVLGGEDHEKAIDENQLKERKK
jgi:hypothetical protein